MSDVQTCADEHDDRHHDHDDDHGKGHEDESKVITTEVHLEGDVNLDGTIVTTIESGDGGDGKPPTGEPTVEVALQDETSAVAVASYQGFPVGTVTVDWGVTDEQGSEMVTQGEAGEDGSGTAEFDYATALVEQQEVQVTVVSDSDPAVKAQAGLMLGLGS